LQSGLEPFDDSDSNGAFAIGNVNPGQYVVRLSGNTNQTSPRNRGGFTVSVSPGGSVFAGEFLVAPTTGSTPPGGKISGIAWDDRDGDAQQDADELPIAGRTVYIDADNTGTLTPIDSIAVTDSAGGFLFSSRTAGTYRVRQVLPAGWEQTRPSAGAGLSVSLTTNQHATGALFASRLVAPSAGGPYSIAEGESLSLAGTSSSAAGASFAWDINGDGDFSDATGSAPTLTWQQLAALGLDDGPDTRSLSVRVSVDGAHYRDSTDAAALTIADTPPLLTVTAARIGEVLEGRPYRIDFAATDPGDDPALHWLVGWGDGTPVELLESPASFATHLYAAGGRMYSITASVVQADGQFTAPVPVQVRVLTPAEAIGRLAAQATSATANLPRGNRQALLAKLRAGESSFAGGKMRAGVDQFESFIEQVTGWRGTKLEADDADALIAAATELLELARSRA
jgi:hypothetical protein